jgi:hypothetical protein
VFNIKRSHYVFNFYLVHAGIASVDYTYGNTFSTSLGNLGFLQSNKNHSHIVLIDRDIHHLVLSDNLNGRGADWLHILRT